MGKKEGWVEREGKQRDVKKVTFVLFVKQVEGLTKHWVNIYYITYYSLSL